MLKIYFKQTLELLKQNRLISAISIIGTALAIMMIMVLIIVQHVNEAEMAPEINRNRTLYLKYYLEKSKDTVNWSWSSSSMSYKYYKDYLSDMKIPELVSIISTGYDNGAMISLEGSKELYPSKVSSTDHNYWKMMSFDFIEGSGYNEADYNSGLKKAVLKESKAKELFGTSSAVGKIINVNFTPYKVTGVVKDVSPIFSYCQGDIFVPYTSLRNYEDNTCYVLFLAKDRGDFDAIKEEVRKAERKFEEVNTETTINFWGPYDQKNQKDNVSSGEGVDESRSSKRMIFVLIILLVVPAINLSSFSMSQIKRRTEEIGIRKAFGATKQGIFKQVLIENFITSLIGGIIGLILSFFMLFWLREWLLNIPENGNIPVGAFISPFVFLAVFAVCLILNLLSAGIPAYKAIKMNIVDSLNRK